MKRRSGISMLVALLIAGSATVLNAAGLAAPSSATLGDAIAVYLPPDRQLDGATVELQDATGKEIVRARAFRFAESNKTAWVALVGIPTTISPGTYRLAASMHGPRGVSLSDVPISIAAREFRRENIALDQDLTTLQTEDSALKAMQARELWSILTTFDSSAVYQIGPLILPVGKYTVTSPFAERRMFVFAHGGDEHSIHQGIDLAVPAGTPISASGAGKVVFSGNWLMTGNTVVIEQLPGVYSLYFHMERSTVSTGEMVHQGQTIGYVGATGLATGPHLHWQIEVGGVAVDPMSLLKAGLIDSSRIPPPASTE